MPKVKCKKCQNKQCGVTNPLEAKFCRKCGSPISDNAEILVCEVENSNVEMDSRPFHMRYPEYNLIPYSEHPANFIFNKPDYIEREYLPHDQDQFLWIVKDGKFGITTYRYEDHWYGDEVHTNRIIKCEYDRIEKADGCFICHIGSQVTYIDLKGNILK